MDEEKNERPDRECKVTGHAMDRLRERIDERVEVEREYITQLYSESFRIERDTGDEDSKYPEVHRVHPSQYVTLQAKRYKEYDKITSVFLMDIEHHQAKGYKLDDLMFCTSCNKLYRHTEAGCDCHWCGADHSHTEWAGWVFRRYPPSKPGEIPDVNGQGAENGQ